MNRPARMAMELLSSIFKKPATEHYPFDRPYVPEGYRGMVTFIPEKCIACRLCVRDCPAGGIEFIKTGERSFDVTIDISKCIFCGQCAENCNKEAILMSEDFEIASISASSLILRYNVSLPERKPSQNL
jgi:formate hydrogenlyase subunit 6/NADH:ubiquinone oxidoreductase subunit I